MSHYCQVRLIVSTRTMIQIPRGLVNLTQHSGADFIDTFTSLFPAITSVTCLACPD